MQFGSVWLREGLQAELLVLYYLFLIILFTHVLDHVTHSSY
jgi:hypothetical protein